MTIVVVTILVVISTPNEQRSSTHDPPPISVSVSATALPACAMLTEPNTPGKTLRDAIADHSFWTIRDLELLELIEREFPDELRRLKKATFVRDPNAPRPPGLSISESLYGQDYDYAEINRTLLGVLALRWLKNDDYAAFVGTQHPSAVVLKRKSFEWLGDIFRDGLRSIDDTEALITSMVINDLGKDPTLATDYAARKGVDISKVNHDMILYHAVEAGMVPALERLNPGNRQNLLLGIKLGSDFNFGQLAQAENAPASLSGLLEMRGHGGAFEMRFMEQVLDLSGAAGHEDWTCAKKMTEPIFQSYRNVYDVAQEIIGAQKSLRDGYDKILTRKLELLRDAGYSRSLDIARPKDRALMRLFCLGNTTNKQDADIFEDAFRRISEESRQGLVDGLNVDGSVHEPAVQVTYAPAMLTKAVGNTADASRDAKCRAIAAMLRYLARCLTLEVDAMDFLPQGVTVVERDVRILIPVLDSEEFQADPDILDNEAIPECQVANLTAG